MGKYTNSKIYRIDVIGCDEIYIGSCYTSLNERFSIHKSDGNTCSSRELFTYGEPTITLIENYSCETKIELCMREQYYMDKFISEGYTLVNKRRAYTSPEMVKEYRENNKEHIKEQQKDYYETHKETIKEYRENNKEHIKEQRKERYENNKEAIKEQQKEYYEKIKHKLNEKFICECGGRYTQQNKALHLQTKRHVNHSSLL